MIQRGMQKQEAEARILLDQAKTMRYYSKQHPELSEAEAWEAWVNKYARTYRQEKERAYRLLGGLDVLECLETGDMRTSTEWAMLLGEPLMLRRKHSGSLREVRYNDNSVVVCVGTGKKMHFWEWAYVLGEVAVLHAIRSGIFALEGTPC